jgi:hypothetical protein
MIARRFTPILHVDVFALLLSHGGTYADTGVVDQDIEPAEAVAMALDDRLDAVLVGHVRRNGLDLVPLRSEVRCRRLQSVRLPRADRQRVTILAQRFSDRTAGFHARPP